MMPAKILVADDDPALLELMSLTLRKEGFRVSSASSAAQARRLIGESIFDVVVSDIYLGDATAIELLDEIRLACPDVAIILVTAQGTVETAAAANAAGVFDYLAKPFEIPELVRRVRAALGGAEQPPAEVDSGPESMIVGNHPRIVEVYKAVARVAPLPVPVLIRGETGTGKELVATALHRYGADPDGPFVPLNCGAIPDTLIESELFGHRRGAFTGADRDHRGAIEEAAGGTVFLDEVGELPAPVQVKLLRFLQEGEIRPLGSSSSVAVPTRVVTATNRDLGREVERGTLREDFYYRLTAYEIVIPPLRDRSSDIPMLVEHFRRRLQDRLGRPDFGGPSDTTLDVLQTHLWPGNVRELENLVQRAAVDLGSLADAAAVRRLLQSRSTAEAPQDAANAIGDDLTLEELERLHIEAVLKRCGGNRTHAARILGIERKSLYRKAQRLGIELDGGDAPEAHE
jgi:DNA-binding NtrC family response regulator